MSLIADCFDCMLIDASGNTFASTTLSSADINIAVDEKEVRAGRGDALISVLHSGRKADIKLSEVTFKWDWIAMQLGQKATTGATTAYALPKFYTIDASKKIVLDEIPIDNSGIKIYKADKTEITSANYTIGGTPKKEVTFTTGVNVGDIVEVGGYKYTTAVTASEITIDNTSFAKGVKCILETIEIAEDESQLSKVQYIFDSVSPSGNISISVKKERDANVMDFSFKALKPINGNNLGRVVRIPLS